MAYTPPRRTTSTASNITVTSSAVPTWPQTVPVSTFASIPYASGKDLITIAPSSTIRNGINQSFSGWSWNEAYGAGGAMVFMGGGHATAVSGQQYAYLFDGSLPGWKPLSVTPPPLVYASGSEFGSQANMPGTAVLYGTTYFYPQPPVPYAPEAAPYTSRMQYGENASGYPAGYHVYNSVFAIPPGKLGMGANGGWGSPAKASNSNESGLHVPWGHKVDADSGAWSRMPARMPQNVGGIKVVDSNTVAYGIAATMGNHAYCTWGAGGEVNAILQIDLDTGAMVKMTTSGSTMQVRPLSKNQWQNIPGTTIFQFLGPADNSGTSQQLRLRLCNVASGDPPTTSTNRQFATAIMPSNILPSGLNSEHLLGCVNSVWVPEVGKIAVFGQSTAFRETQGGGVWPLPPSDGGTGMVIYWITPPADIQTNWRTGTWTMTTETVLIPAGDTKALDRTHRSPRYAQGAHFFWSSKLRCFLYMPTPQFDDCFFIRTALVP